MNTDTMIDLETLDVSPNATVLTIGAVKFDPFDKTAVMDQLYIKVDLDSLEDLDLDIDEGTLEWWSKQSPEAQEEAFSDNDRVDIVDAMNQLYKFCWGTKRVWSHGASFDVVIMENIFRKVRKACPWQYWQIKDTRTLFDMGIKPEMPDGLKHHALHDAYAQAVGVQNVIAVLESKGIEMFKDMRNV